MYCREQHPPVKQIDLFLAYLAAWTCSLKIKPTLVWTVNLTLSCSLRASEMSTTKLVSVCRSIVSVLGCRHKQQDTGEEHGQ